MLSFRTLLGGRPLLYLVEFGTPVSSEVIDTAANGGTGCHIDTLPMVAGVTPPAIYGSGCHTDHLRKELDVTPTTFRAAEQTPHINQKFMK
jgi:hypothetical protein